MDKQTYDKIASDFLIQHYIEHSIKGIPFDRWTSTSSIVANFCDTLNNSIATHYVEELTKKTGYTFKDKVDHYPDAFWQTKLGKESVRQDFHELLNNYFKQFRINSRADLQNEEQRIEKIKSYNKNRHFEHHPSKGIIVAKDVIDYLVQAIDYDKDNHELFTVFMSALNFYIKDFSEEEANQMYKGQLDHSKFALQHIIFECLEYMKDYPSMSGGFQQVEQIKKCIDIIGDKMPRILHGQSIEEVNYQERIRNQRNLTKKENVNPVEKNKHST